MLSAIFFFSPIVCLILIFTCVSQARKIEKLQAKLDLQDVPEIIKMKQEKHKIEQEQLQASLRKTNLEIERMINKEGKFYLKVLKADLAGCLKGSKSGYAYLKFTNRQLEVIPSYGCKATMKATWEEPRTYNR